VDSKMRKVRKTAREAGLDVEGPFFDGPPAPEQQGLVQGLELVIGIIEEITAGRRRARR
jgi:hypothetical protein